MREVVGEAVEEVDGICGMGATINGGKKESELVLFDFADDKFGGIVIERIGAGENLNAERVANVEPDATTAHSLSVDMKKVEAVEGKVRVARMRVHFSFADGDCIEVRVSNLGLEQRKVRRE